MKNIYKYIVLFFYSCLSSVLMLLFLGGAVVTIYYMNNGVFYFPLSQVKRAIVFGCIAGTAITAAAIVFNLIDYFKARRSPPSDPD